MTEIAEGRMCIRLGCTLRGEMTQEERCPSCNHFTQPWREQPHAESTLGTVPVGIGAQGGPAPVGRPGRRSTLKTLRYVRLGVILILIVAGLVIGAVAKSNARKGAQPINAGNQGGAGPSASAPADPDPQYSTSGITQSVLLPDSDNPNSLDVYAIYNNTTDNLVVPTFIFQLFDDTGSMVETDTVDNVSIYAHQTTAVFDNVGLGGGSHAVQVAVQTEISGSEVEHDSTGGANILTAGAAVILNDGSSVSATISSHSKSAVEKSEVVLVCFDSANRIVRGDDYINIDPIPPKSTFNLQIDLPGAPVPARCVMYPRITAIGLGLSKS